MIRKPIVQINKKTLNNRVDAENDRRHGPCGASPAPSGHFRSRQALDQLKTIRQLAIDANRPY